LRLFQGHDPTIESSWDAKIVFMKKILLNGTFNFRGAPHPTYISRHSPGLMFCRVDCDFTGDAHNGMAQSLYASQESPIDVRF
jgi:hypothetical protein